MANQPTRFGIYAIQHSARMLGAARHNWLPWIYPDYHNHEIWVLMLMDAPLDRRPSPLKWRQNGLTWPRV